jgi:hypothetical protein
MDILRSWRELKVMLKRRFPVLNDEDFKLENEDREGMLSKISAKLNKTRAELDALLAEFQRY